MNRLSHSAVSLKFGFLAAAGAMGALWLAPAPAQAGDVPDKIELSGIVRDFRERSDPQGHPDFEQRPDLALEHCGSFPSRPLALADGVEGRFELRALLLE
mgnify:CR=1 FL=1